MAIITEEQLKSYCGNYNDDTLNSIYINSAVERIEKYLGYAVEAMDYSIIRSGNGEKFFDLGVKQINSVTSITVNEEEKDITNLIIDAPFIYSKDFYFREGDYNVNITFNAGFTSIPNTIALTALKIATVLKLEEGGNVAVKSKSFEDGSREFLEKKIENYLKDIEDYRI